MQSCPHPQTICLLRHPYGPPAIAKMTPPFAAIPPALKLAAAVSVALVRTLSATDARPREAPDTRGRCLCQGIRLHTPHMPVLQQAHRGCLF